MPSHRRKARTPASPRPVLGGTLALLLWASCAPVTPEAPPSTVSDDGAAIAIAEEGGSARFTLGELPGGLARLPVPAGATSEEGFAFEVPGAEAAALTVALSPGDVLAFYERELPGAGFVPEARALTERGGSLVARGAPGSVTVVVKARDDSEGGGTSLVVSLSHGEVTPPPPTGAS